MESFSNLLTHLVYFTTVSSCCLQDMEETQQGLGTANRKRRWKYYSFSWWILSCLLARIQPEKKNRSGKRISLVPPRRMKCLNNPVQHYQIHDYSFKHLKGSKRHKPYAHITWDIQCNLCTTWTVQIKNYGRAVLDTVNWFQQWWK